MPWEEEDASVRAAGGILQGKLLHPGGKACLRWAQAETRACRKCCEVQPWAVHRPKHPIVILGGTRLLVVLQSGIVRCNQLIT